jgi:hypothetical protein
MLASIVSGFAPGVGVGVGLGVVVGVGVGVGVGVLAVRAFASKFPGFALLITGGWVASPG